MYNKELTEWNRHYVYYAISRVLMQETLTTMTMLCSEYTNTQDLQSPPNIQKFSLPPLLRSWSHSRCPEKQVSYNAKH